MIRERDWHVKAVLCSAKFLNGDVRNNIDKITSACEKFSHKADVLLFGEAFLQGFDGLTWNYETDKNIAVECDSPEMMEIRAAAVRNHVAVGFGYMECEGDAIYSSYAVMSAEGELLCNYRRMSPGWKVRRADGHYREGGAPVLFEMCGMRFAVALCGDLWTDDVAEDIKNCQSDAILWPVYTDFDSDEWNTTMKLEYAEQAARYCEKVLLVNSVCDGDGMAKGGSVYFYGGMIKAEVCAGEENVLTVEV